MRFSGFKRQFSSHYHKLDYTVRCTTHSRHLRKPFFIFIWAQMLFYYQSSVSRDPSQFPGGYLADKHGRRWLIVSMTLGLAIGSLFFIFAPSWQFILIGLLIQNVCSIYGPALMSMIMDSLPPENRGSGFSFQSVITTLVLLPAPLIAQYLVITLISILACESRTRL
jgi:MFS family permease